MDLIDHFRYHNNRYIDTNVIGKDIGSSVVDRIGKNVYNDPLTVKI